MSQKQQTNELLVIYLYFTLLCDTSVELVTKHQYFRHNCCNKQYNSL